MFKFIFIFLCFFLTAELHSKESLLTLKQQLDRLQREVSDLSQLVFKGSRDEQLEVQQNNNQTNNLTAFDLRIYDLEKDIKKLNENFEELIFQIDDLKKLYQDLNIDISKKLLNIDNNVNLEIEDSSEVLENKKNENSLGTLIINSEDLTENIENDSLKPKNQEEKDENINKEIIKLTPEEEFQKAFDMIRNQQFFDAKEALKKFITKHKDDKLVGSAHYWLGEIYLLKKEYREAALILAEGYQKFPQSFKAPDMLFKLSESLMNIDKKDEACNTLKKLISEFPKHKLSSKAKEKSLSLKCISAIE